MKKYIKLIIVSIFLILLTSCSKSIFVEQKMDNYNNDTFYINDLKTIAADPSVIYIDEGEERGYYYMYITSDDINGTGFLAYKSKDMINWQCTGIALNSYGYYDEENDKTIMSFSFFNYWAPECIYDSESKLYYLFYNASKYDPKFSTNLNFYIDMAVSENPYGPFVPYNKYIGKEPVCIDEKQHYYAYEPYFDFANMDIDDPLYEKNTNGYMKVIDASPFIDPSTGKKYLYFCHDLSSANAISNSSIYVIELNDDFSPNYNSVHRLTAPNKYNLEEEENIELNEGSVNEAPFMVYNQENKMYYLLYSANSYLQKTYSVRVAISSSPTGPFRKLSQEEGGFLLYAEPHWSWSSGTGHCSIVTKDNHSYIIYHAHQDTIFGNSKRSVAIDEINWTKNKDGLEVMVANGPSIGLMPKTTSKYINIAKKASISSPKVLNDINYLNDGIIKFHDLSFVNECKFEDGQNEITIEFDDYETVAGISIFNSCDYDYMFSGIKDIEFETRQGTKKSGSLTFDWDNYYTEDGFVIPGGSFNLSFDEIETKSIKIILDDVNFNYAISEIEVLGLNNNYIDVDDVDPNASYDAIPCEDDSVVFDGIVNAEEYKGEKVSFEDTNGVKLDIYSKMSKDGIYFGFKSNDKNVYYNDNAEVYQNTSVEVQMALGGTKALNANVIQLRYGVDGSYETWIGINSAKDYQYMRSCLKTASKVHINGDINSNNCEGYDVEAYVPYSDFNIDYKPESIIIAPSFNTRNDYEATGRMTWTIMVGSSFSDPTSWFKVTDDGLTNMTNGFSVTGNNIKQRGGSNQFYYFDDELLENYYLNIDVEIGNILNDDPFPKIGVVNKSFSSLQGYYLDIANRRINNVGKIYAETTEFGGTNWAWESNSSHSFGMVQSIKDLSINSKLNIELMRYNNQFTMLINGKYVLGDIDIKGMNNGSIPGLLFFNSEANITLNVFESDENKVKSYASLYAPNINIDGDLQDWDLNKTLINKETDSTNNNSMATYAYRDEKGLYIAYEVHHNYNPKIYMWNEGNDERGVWYYNTNAEFWVNDDHYALTCNGDSGFMLKKMITTEDLNTGKYTTIAEVFIPKELINNDINVGFAFKTCDKAYANPSEIDKNDMKFNGDPWWYFSGHFPTDINERFKVN